MGGIVCTKCRKSHLLPHLENNNNNNNAHLFWKCSCGFEANPEKVGNFLTKLEGELEMLETLEEGNPSKVKEKVVALEHWLSKKEKVLPRFSDLRVRAEGTLALLLVRLGPDPKVLDKREKIARSRIDLLHLVDPAPSRMRGFEVFRLYIVLLHRKMALLKCNVKKVPAEVEDELEEQLLEAQWLLGEDSSAPAELRLQWEEMVTSKGWEGEVEGKGQGTGWEGLQRARLAVARRWPGQPVLE